MRVFIISDMEGVAGITKWEQVTGGHAHYPEGQKLYTAEMNAAARGAFDAGADEVILMDCHGAGKGWTFNSLLHEELDPRVEYVVQNEWTEHTDTLEEGCDAALFVGMHAMAGADQGGLSHTVSGTDWHYLKFNGTEVGETGINAALCGQWRTPVLMVTGDQVVCAEAKALLGEGLTTVQVKKSYGRYSARHIAPQRAREMIYEGAKSALSNLKAVEPYVVAPAEIEVRLHQASEAEVYKNRDGIEFTDGRTIVSKADDWLTAWQRIYL
jgi:D-amino peptidase